MKSWFRKFLNWVPDFPGVSSSSVEQDLIDLKNPSLPIKRRRKTGKILLLCFGVIGCALIWVNTVLQEQRRAVMHARQAPMELMVSAEGQQFDKPTRRYTVLVMGKEDDNRADTLILCNLRIDKGEVRLLSFPRDTRVLTVHNGFRVRDKISHAFRWGGLQSVKNSTQEFLRVPIDHTVIIDLVLFRKIIDALGGVTVDVEKDLKYVDKAGGLSIDIDAGTQKLMGHDAEGYVRYRSDGLGDLGRIERQKKFITAFLDQVRGMKLFGWDSFRILGRLPGFMLDLYQDIDTSIPVDLFVKLLLAFHDMEPDSVSFQTLRGAGRYVHTPGYKKKINFYMSSPDQIAASRSWFLGDEELDPQDYSREEWFSQFQSAVSTASQTSAKETTNATPAG